MSGNLSLDEIIKRAEEIKRETERQLEAAEKNLDEKSKNVEQEVVVDEKEVAERIAKVYEKLDSEDEDIKEYVPAKKAPSKFIKAQKIEEDEDDEDIKIVTEVEPAADDKTNVVPLIGKKKFKLNDNSDEKTKQVMFVSSSDKPEDENDLQEIPTIFAKEHIYDGYDTPDSDEVSPYDEIGVQMTFEGFDDKIESVPRIDEEVAEQILLERRQEKVGKFRLFGPDETDAELGENKEVKEDYMKASDKSKFFASLKSKRAALKLKMIATAVLAVPMLLITVFRNSAYFPVSLSSHGGYFTCAIILYILLLAVNYNVIVHGFNIKHRLNYDFPIALVSILIFIHTIVSAFYNSLWIDNGVLLILTGAFGLFMSQLGKSRMMTRIIDNFKFITDTEEKYTVENITNAVDAEIISRGLLDDEEEPLIKTSVKCDFPTNFMEISCKREEASRIAKLIFPLSFLLSLVLLITLGILDNFNTAINMSLCSLAITLPCCVLYLGNTMLCDVSANLDEYGSRVCGYEGAFMAQGANAMVMEAADLFSKNSCEMHGIKTFGGTQVDQAIIQAAAVMTQTKSPLAKVFDSVIIGKQSILPPVEGITYEDKMGTSAWIYKRKVLVGNRDLLLRHGVNVPKESFERKYTIKGRKALYLAINGNIAAMFVVSYSADPKLKRELRKLEKSGITIIVKSCDPYINEKSITKLFNLPEGFIRVMNYSSARVYDKYSNMNVEKSPAYVVHNGSALGFVSAMRSAQIIVSTRKLIGFLTCFGSAIGFATVTLLSVLEAYQSITALNIIIFQAIWNFFILLIVKIRGLSL
ncbi:MAG: hypothetical protein IJS03_04765 [Eubacterium sp.]|nr:hypothetical protein [Eubacterium sp.]